MMENKKESKKLPEKTRGRPRKLKDGVAARGEKLFELKLLDDDFDDAFQNIG